MRKLVLIAVVALMALCSCEKIDLTEKVPQLKGSWKWNQTAVGGVVGIIHADTEKSLVLVFGDDNKISIEYNGETLVSEETYSCKKSNVSQYGDYLISMPKAVQKKITECLDGSGYSVVTDGYIRFSALYSGDDTLYLIVTEEESKDCTEEGGCSNFHCSSVFAPVRP